MYPSVGCCSALEVRRRALGARGGREQGLLDHNAALRHILRQELSQEELEGMLLPPEGSRGMTVDLVREVYESDGLPAELSTDVIVGTLELCKEDVKVRSCETTCCGSAAVCGSNDSILNHATAQMNHTRHQGPSTELSARSLVPGGLGPLRAVLACNNMYVRDARG